MDAFISRLSYHATSYAIRSCLALTSTLVIQQGSRLLKTVNDDPLRAELASLQRRLARKIELISPILESIEFQYTRGNLALETCVQTTREIREDIDALARRLQDAAILQEQPVVGHKQQSAPERHAELLSVLTEMKQVMTSIDDAIPSINLWVSAIGGIQAQPSAFSPSRLLQASMLVNIGDTQYVLNPSQPMQIGPDFALSLYMLFQGHASPQDGEGYGFDEGQRKPTWQEVVHKARVRLYRLPPQNDGISQDEEVVGGQGYAYSLQIVEDLDDGRVHTFEDGNAQPGPYDGVLLAGIRELIPVGQVSKMFYADVGRILNIQNEDGASSNPVLLLKKDTTQQLPSPVNFETKPQFQTLENAEEPAVPSCSTPSESSTQDDIDRQLREESLEENVIEGGSHHQEVQPVETPEQNPASWTIPHNLDPEWIALEVYDFDDSVSSTDGDETGSIPDESDTGSKPPRRSAASRMSVDGNLMNQLHRMSLSRSQTPDPSWTSGELMRSIGGLRPPMSPSLVERSPFGAIKTSLSLLEMLLRLTSLQEFEQTTHLAIPDHVLKFYLDESASESGLHGKERWAARAEAARKVGFDPYTDGPGSSAGGA
ncbi:hypothetical protein JX265_001276 [Neoarthrinium moseri]|uniref:Ran-specific GTPase-activating protein 30 n=1 Tax=Neoarthrinium moseri TaxID=1658444 RepID=A0A9Q0AVQ7_9PEZI|nr:uncharacterized protein JN550_010726 [Neoarthrinium moseri]KAI1861656.1 hypothetical protein JN550_010726 [Neoarthrinium moseri]KAI1881036.1 hypothetical protein JX265_001276 [Neoarthrinium moseri]